MMAFLLQIPTVPATGAAAVDYGWLFIKMLIALGIVTVLAILALKYGVPRWTGGRRFIGGRLFRIVARQTLVQNKSLFLVHVGKRYLLLGVADSAINLITELDPREVEGDAPSSP